MADGGPSVAVRVFGQLDLLIIVAALPLVLALDLPIAGYAVASGAWLIQRFGRSATERRIARGGEARTIALLTAATLVVPIWFMSFAVLIVGLVAGRESGLEAALLTIILFTVNLTARMMVKRAAAPDRDPA